MSPENVALVAAMAFFLVGLLSGTWKYVEIHRSADGVAPEYVSVCHRASLMYAFACVLLERMLIVGQLPPAVEYAALAALLLYFALAVFGYALHGWLKDTDNQLRRPHVLGTRTLSDGFMRGLMVSLVVAETLGFLVLAVGVLMAL